MPLPPVHSLSLLLRKVQASHVSVMVYEVAARWGTSSPFKARQGYQAGGKGPTSRQHSQKRPLIPLLGFLQEDQATQLQHCAGGPGQAHPSSLPGSSVSVSPHEPRPVDSKCFTWGIVGPPGSHNPSSPSSTGFPEVHLMFGCGSPQKRSFLSSPLSLSSPLEDPVHFLHNTSHNGRLLKILVIW